MASVELVVLRYPCKSGPQSLRNWPHDWHPSLAGNQLFIQLSTLVTWPKTLALAALC